MADHLSTPRPQATRVLTGTAVGASGALTRPAMRGDLPPRPAAPGIPGGAPVIRDRPATIPRPWAQGHGARPGPPAGPERAAVRAAAEQDLPEHLVPVLAQLLTGATDLTASQRLGVSPCTFSRRVCELLDHLGVLSRFQAGVAAVDHGWLVPRQHPTAPRP